MLDKVYNDFVTNVLPLVQQGLVITKDYFMDLFGRYVKYLIISDSIYILLSILSFIVFLILVIKRNKRIKELKQENYPDENYLAGSTFLMVLFSILLVVSCVSIIINTTDLIKDLTVPEVRVYEIIWWYKNNHT